MHAISIISYTIMASAFVQVLGIFYPFGPLDPRENGFEGILVSHCVPMCMVMRVGGLLLIIVLSNSRKHDRKKPKAYHSTLLQNIPSIENCTNSLLCFFFSQSNTKGLTLGRALPDPRFFVALLSWCRPLRAYSVYGGNLIAHSSYCKGHGCRHDDVVGSFSSKSAPYTMRPISSSLSLKHVIIPNMKD